MEFSRQEHWSGLPFPSPGDLPIQGLDLGFLHCRQILYRLSHQGSPTNFICHKLLSQCPKAQELQLLKTANPRACALQQEKPPQ